MGISPFKHSSCSCPVTTVPVSPNPDPTYFEITHAAEYNGHTVVAIIYPNCTTYEGRKCLVFRNTKVFQVQQMKTIDPHFCDDPSHRSPFARFEPTKDGWDAAVALCKLL